MCIYSCNSFVKLAVGKNCFDDNETPEIILNIRDFSLEGKSNQVVESYLNSSENPIN